MYLRVSNRFFVTVGALVFVAMVTASIATPVGRDALAWVYLQSTQAVGHCIHFRFFSLDRLDPTCPQCM
ncbi:MAG TPA: hypothetical protein VFW30_06885 [Bryocella sp.]|nr:hypothetical protein [Bryocella sp.]